MPDAHTADTGLEFKDRSFRLRLFGLLTLLVGLLCFLLALLHLVALPFAQRLPGAEGLATDTRAFVMGALVYLLLGAAFVLIGRGSMRKRRWVRPMMLTLAWAWLLGGLLVLAFLPGLTDGALATAGEQVDAPGVFAGIKLFVLALGALAGVVAPATLIWAYRDRDLLRTCEAYDPAPAWTDRCPASVLGLSVSLVAAAALALPLALHPAVPWFGRVVTGWPGGLLILGGAGASVVLARWTYALRPAGWWGSGALLLLTGFSTLITIVRVGPAALYAELGYSEQALEMLGRTGSLSKGWNGWATALLTLASLAYMAGIRKHFAADRVAGDSSQSAALRKPVGAGDGASGLPGSSTDGEASL